MYICSMIMTHTNMKTIKYHKTFGQIEVLESNDTNITVLVVATSEKKSLMTKFTTLSDSPIKAEVVKTKKVKVKAILTSEQESKNNIETLKVIFLSVNNRWNANSTYNTACSIISKISPNGSEMIESIKTTFFKFNKISEKQAYVLAAEANNQNF